MMQHLLNIHFYAPRLWECVREQPAMLYFVFNADVIAVLVAHDLQRGEMVAQVETLVMPSHGPVNPPAAPKMPCWPQRAHAWLLMVPALQRSQPTVASLMTSDIM